MVAEDPQCKETSLVTGHNQRHAIADCLSVTIAEFHQLLTSDKLNDANCATKVRPSLWSDQLGRLRLWAANIGAHLRGTAALDFRLRDASHIAIEIIDFLSQLGTILTETRKHIDGQENAGSIGSPESQDSSDFYDDSKSDYECMYDSVVLRIDCLFKVSLAVRRPAKIDRIARLKKSEWESYRPHDLRHVDAKFPQMSEKLLNRLVDALSLRRGILKEYEERHLRYARGIAAAFGDAAEADSTVDSRMDSSILQQSMYQDVLDVVDTRSVGVASSRSMKTVLDVRRPFHIRPPRAIRDRKPYECPHCHYMLDIYETKDFARHVFEDITPYQCIFPDCQEDQRLLASKTAWLNHMATEHNGDGLEDSKNGCMMCGERQYTETSIELHVSRHLEELALFVLRDTEEEDDSDPHIGDEDKTSSTSSPASLVPQGSANDAAHLQEPSKSRLKVRSGLSSSEEDQVPDLGRAVPGVSMTHASRSMQAETSRAHSHGVPKTAPNSPLLTNFMPVSQSVDHGTKSQRTLPASRNVRSQSALKRQDDESSDDKEDDDPDRLPYFVPEEGIDIEPLASYVRGILDHKARIRIGNHPSRREQKGFWVDSIVAINVEDISAMIDDTKSWRKEKSVGYYVNSSTAQRRKKIGRPKATAARTMAIARATLPIPSNVTETGAGRGPPRSTRTRPFDYTSRQQDASSEYQLVPVHYASESRYDTQPRTIGPEARTASNTESANVLSTARYTAVSRLSQTQDGSYNHLVYEPLSSARDYSSTPAMYYAQAGDSTNTDISHSMHAGNAIQQGERSLTQPSATGTADFGPIYTTAADIPRPSKTSTYEPPQKVSIPKLQNPADGVSRNNRLDITDSRLSQPTTRPTSTSRRGVRDAESDDPTHTSNTMQSQSRVTDKLSKQTGSFSEALGAARRATNQDRRPRRS